MLNVPFSIMPVAPWLMLGNAISELTALGILLLKWLCSIVVNFSRRPAPEWQKLSGRTTLLMLRGPVVVRDVVLGKCENSLGAMAPICPLAARVSSMAVTSNRRGEAKLKVYPGRGNVLMSNVHLLRTCRTCVCPDLCGTTCWLHRVPVLALLEVAGVVSDPLFLFLGGLKWQLMPCMALTRRLHLLFSPVCR